MVARKRIFVGDILARASKRPRTAEAWTSPHIERIEKTDIPSWGSPEKANARAQLETADTTNEQLLRTHHSALSNVEDVSIMIERATQARIWVVSDPRAGIYAGGREIHLFPTHGVFPFPSGLPVVPDVSDRQINPRELLSETDIELIRRFFPGAIGARVFITGFMVILYHSESDIRDSWEEYGIGDTWGNLTVIYDVEDTRPTHNSGTRVSDKAEDLNSAASLGLKLRLPDGTECLTVPTHAFVKVTTSSRATPLLRRTTDILVKVKEWAKVKMHLHKIKTPAIAGTRGEKTDTPIGKEAWVAGTNDKLGDITITYDSVPLPTEDPYPHGYSHDLSLVTGNNLPGLASPLASPRIVGWGGVKDVLNGAPCFIAGQYALTGNPKIMTGTGATAPLRKAIVEGVHYSWQHKNPMFSSAILWRTDHDWDSAEGLSGCVLCHGHPKDEHVTAVCFRNFETAVTAKQLAKDMRGKPGAKFPFYSVKGGFILPDDILQSTIILDDAQDRRNITYPLTSHEQMEKPARRSFSEA